MTFSWDTPLFVQYRQDPRPLSLTVMDSSVCMVDGDIRYSDAAKGPQIDRVNQLPRNTYGAKPVNPSIRITDVHAGRFPHRIKAFKYLDTGMNP